MAKQRTHNEWFRPVQRGGRKSCPTCKVKLEPGERIWCWGEYVHGKWHNVQDVCKACFPDILPKLKEHEDECGCTFELVAYCESLPEWLTLEPKQKVVSLPPNPARLMDALSRIR